MNSKLIAFLMLAVLSPLALAGCSNAETAASEEVVFDSKSPAAADGEIVITNADLKKNADPVTTTFARTSSGSQTLADRSTLETSTDGFGTKTERRTFNGHPRLRMIVLRTAVDGRQEMTVYGFGSDTKTLYDFGDRALTATADEIANAAGLTVTRAYTDTPGFMRRENRGGGQSSASQTPLQPLPSSVFARPQPAQQPAGETPPAQDPSAGATQQNEPKEEEEK